ncbi:MerR family transcriptional regulator [Gibbsiella greigii]
MLLKVGELARRCGLTIRTLHYYDSIGLLVPSARSEAGYRLYNWADITRLHHIQALRRMGVALAEVGAILQRADPALPFVIEQQITMLDRQLAQMTALRGRLQHLHTQLTAGDEPELNDWLTTLELMAMYDNYFTVDELAQLPFYQPDEAREQQWAEMVAEAQALLDTGTSEQTPQAQALARRWMCTLERDTANNPTFLVKLNAMHSHEAAIRQQTGITPAVVDYITRAFGESKLAIFQNYLSADEYAYVRRHYFDRLHEWPPLIAKFHRAMADGVPASSAQAGQLAGEWLALFRSYASDDPATQAKIRHAMAQEPALAEGTWLTPALLSYLQQAIGHGMQR